MSLDPTRTNGFRIRALNQDCDRLAVQSSLATTWWLSRGRGGVLGRWFPKAHEVGIGQNELVVLRPYGAAPEIELEGLGGPYGVLIVQCARGATRTLRNGQKATFALGKDESVVIKTEYFKAPGSDGQQFARV
jgi:hypothetical protein